MAQISLSHIDTLGERNRRVYRALSGPDAIRLLVLQPGDQDERITCNMLTFIDCTQSIPYEALSYCWGEFSEAVEISCDDVPFFISPSLWTALQRVRLTSGERTLWVDAVCVNQHDIAERSQQVSIMKRIYANASRVLVWLGPGDGDTAPTVEAIRRLSENCCEYHYGPRSRMQHLQSMRQERDLRNFAQPPAFEMVSPKSWRDLSAIFACEWFRRIWIVQEIQSCHEALILWGDEHLEWCQVLLAANLLYSDPMHRSCGGVYSQQNYPGRTPWEVFAIPQVLFMADQPMRVRSRVPFLEVLHASNVFISSDARDKIFSMLWHPISSFIADDRSELQGSNLESTQMAHLHISPDYIMSAAELDRPVAVKSIELTGSLEILSMSSPNADILPTVPGWVPRWGMPDFTGHHVMPTWLYTSSRHYDAQFTWSNSLSTVQGLGLGTMDLVSAVITRKGMHPRGMGTTNTTMSYVETSTWQDIGRIISQDRRRDTHIDGYENADVRVEGASEEHFEDFAAWLISDEDMQCDFHYPVAIRGCDHCVTPVYSSQPCAPMPIVAYTCGICNRGDVDICLPCYREKGIRCGEAHQCHLRICTSLWWEYSEKDLRMLQLAAASGNPDRFHNSIRDNHAYFVTSAGHIGSASNMMREGDFVCVLLGASVPFILRRQSDGRCRVIGDCYVDGMMDGKAIDMWEAGELELEDFTLC
ncbi:hypothetical protein LTR95_004940 [Oleoguttula sp. CCFEE 5521]